MITPPQIDDHVPASMVRYIGAARTFASRSRFWFAYPQFIMIAILLYKDSPTIQTWFPSIWAWGIALFAAGVAAMLFEYGVVYPAQITFNRDQTARKQRDPVYREVVELREDVADLKEGEG